MVINLMIEGNIIWEKCVHEKSSAFVSGESEGGKQDGTKQF